MTKPKIELNPKHPERICWGCDKYCSANDLRCGNGTIRSQHPIELFGEDWLKWELNSGTLPIEAAQPPKTESSPSAVIDALESSQSTTELLG